MDWYDWQHHDFSYPSDTWLIMLYQLLTGQHVLTDERIQAIKDMWGFDRRKRDFKIPTEDGYKIVESEEEGSATSMIRNYWFGRHYGLIDPAW